VPALYPVVRQRGQREPEPPSYAVNRPPAGTRAAAAPSTRPRGRTPRPRLLHLDSQGPATSTSLARALGQNTGATSYHLRQLAEHGFVEDAPEQGHGRERWWRARRQDIRFPPRSTMSADMRATFDEFARHGVAEDIEAFARFQRQRDAMGEWGDGLLFSRGALHLTKDELLQFWNDYMELLRRYAAATDPPSEGARRLLVRFVAFPDVDGE
jgi:DNA-binding transcriptional ArsR family regulator